ncbi:MAG: DnaD domain protein [Chloroflexi bacterium]|nr:DnaD domain protein [Chloroflexota bacterium]
MTPFPGFPAGKTRFTPIPDLFFSELLVDIDDLAELKVTLYMFWFLHRQRGYPHYMTLKELEGERVVLSALQRIIGEDQDPIDVLRAAVDKAVARGTLLRIQVRDEAESADYLFANTPLGRKAVEQVKRGQLLLETSGYVRQVTPEPERPNIFELYEQNIGLLQPIIADELREAEDTYPTEWIEDAFRLAAENNVRNWRYIRSILDRWAREGKDDGTSPAHRRGFARPPERRSRGER